MLIQNTKMPFANGLVNVIYHRNPAIACGLLFHKIAPTHCFERLLSRSPQSETIKCNAHLATNAFTHLSQPNEYQLRWSVKCLALIIPAFASLAAMNKKVASQMQETINAKNATRILYSAQRN